MSNLAKILGQMVRLSQKLNYFFKKITQKYDPVLQ